MTARAPRNEELLEGAALTLVAALLTGAGVLLFGRVSGAVRHTHRRSQPSPSHGSVPAERHQHTSAVSAR